MRTKKITILFLSIIIGCVIVIVINNIQNNFAFNKSIENINTASWREVPIRDGESFAHSYSTEFDLEKTITDADYIFCGTVVSRKEYEVEWIDDNGEQWGPFPSSVIEVKINKEYYGKSPVEGDIIRVYYPYSLSTVFDGSFIIKDNGEYVFVTQALDEEFVQRRRKEVPDDKFEQEKYADVYISSPSYSLMPVDDGMVFMYHDYFGWDEQIMKKAKSEKSVKTDKMSSSELVETGWFMALDEDDFNSSFSQILEKPEELPNADDLKNLRKIGNYLSQENIE